MKFQHIFLFILISSGISWHCKKDNDNAAPFVTILAPSENQSYSVGQTIHIKFKVEDESKIEFAQVSVSDENGLQVLSPVTFHDLTNDAVMDADVLIDNATLVTGSYFIAILSSDGKNEKNAFRKITIQEVPLRQRAIYLTCSALAQNKIYKIDSVGYLSLAYALNGDFIGSAIDSKSSRMITCGAYTGKLQATRLTDYTEAWSENPIGVTYPCYRFLYSARGLYFVSYSNGLIKGFDYSGAQKFSATANSGVFYPLKSALSSNYLLSEQAPFLAGLKKLVLYNYPAGSAKQEVNLNGDVVAMHVKNDDEFFVFYNQGNAGKISLYSSSGNGFSYTYPYALSGKIKAVTQLSSSVYLVATASGIYQYTYETQNYTAFKLGNAAERILYDISNNQVITSEGPSLKFYDYNTGLLVNSITASDSIADFQVLYNR